MFSSSLGYYLVKSNSKYGIINSNEELVIHIEYDSIGVDSSLFPNANLKSQYLLYDKLIPVCLNEKWGLFDIAGKKIAEVEYDKMGCEINEDMTDRILDNALTVGDTEVVIVGKGDLYGGVSSRGDLLLPIMFQYVYSVTSGGETSYYVVYNDVDYNATEYINRMKEMFGYVSEEENNDPEQNTNNEGNDEQEEGNNSEEENNETSGNINITSIFNSSFEAYAGAHSKNTILALIETVRASNLAHNDHKVQIEYNGNTYIDNTSELSELIDATSYTVKIEHNAESGYVEKIIIN